MTPFRMTIVLTIAFVMSCVVIVPAATPGQPTPDGICASDLSSLAAGSPEEAALLDPPLQAIPHERPGEEDEQIGFLPEESQVLFSVSFVGDEDHRLQLDRINTGLGLTRWDRAYERPLDLTALLAGHEPAWGEPGQSTKDTVASMLHHMGNTLPVGITAGLLTSDRQSTRDAGRAARDSIIATTAATHLLKAVIDSPRPADPTNLDGFPSGHTSMSVAFARAIAEEHDGWGAAAYLWAGSVAWSRVHRGDHSVEQVIAGALLGWFIADATNSAGRRVDLSRPGGGGGVMVPAGGVKW